MINNQTSLFGDLDNFTLWKQEWQDMPEFEQENLKPYKTIELYCENYFNKSGKYIKDRIIKIHFENFENVIELGKLLEIKGINPETTCLKYNIEKFRKIVNQTITEETKSLWYPELQEVRYMDKRWINTNPIQPKYPIYIISKGRSDTRLTSKALERMNIPYHIVIEPQEYKQYSSVIDKKKILVLPFSNLGEGSIPARNWVWEHSISIKAEKHWILDDNINSFGRCNRNLKVWSTSGDIFRIPEIFVDRYENIALSGLNYWMFIPRKEKIPAFYFNTRIYSCILIRNDIPYRWRGRYNEDTDLSIRVLKDNWCTILFNTFWCDKSQTMTMKGGNTDELYSGTNSGNLENDGRYKMAKSLVEQHPDIARITWKWNRYQHYVDYSIFKRTKLIRKKDLNIPNRINNYNMVLKTL